MNLTMKSISSHSSAPLNGPLPKCRCRQISHVLTEQQRVALLGWLPSMRRDTNTGLWLSSQYNTISSQSQSGNRKKSTFRGSSACTRKDGESESLIRSRTLSYTRIFSLVLSSILLHPPSSCVHRKVFPAVQDCRFFFERSPQGMCFLLYSPHLFEFI